MATLKLNDVRVMLADGRTHIRSTLKTALAHAGLENIEHATRIGGLSESVDQSFGPDILICDMGLGGGDACETVSAIRHNEVGRNPFLCIIGVTWNPTEVEVDRVINSGVDLLVAAPMSPQQILDRIEALVHNRMPFIVTGDYVGPDRRKEPERESRVPLVEVPNTLRAKALGAWNPVRMRAEIEGAIGDLKSRKMDRQAAEIDHLADLIVAQTNLPGPTMVRAHIDRLDHLVAQMNRRADEEGFAHVAELCQASVRVVAEMRASAAPPAEKDLALLKHLALAIRTALSPRAEDELIAHDIARTVIGAR